MYTRRDVLRLLGGVSAIGALSPHELLAIGQRTHQSLRRDRSPLGFFDVHQLHTVAAAADRILPETETPGAAAAECHRFIERIVAEHYAAPRQKRFIDGLVNLDVRSSRALQRLFIDIPVTGQDSILAGVEQDAAAVVPVAESFWRDLKELTLIGFYTSRIGIEDELEINFFPGAFDGCAPLDQGAG